MQSLAYTLTNEQWRGVAVGLMAVADKRDFYKGEMIGRGFEAFIPHSQSIENFAQNEEQLKVHRRCAFELMKEQFSEPAPRMGSQAYWSSFLDQMRAERDQCNGMSLAELKKAIPFKEYMWREHYDPCMRALERACQDNPGVRNMDAIWEAVNARFAQESVEKATEITRETSFSDRDQRETFAVLMQRYAGDLGFVYEPKMSPARGPVFVKPLKNEWSLMFVIRYHRYFFWDTPSWTFPLDLILAKRSKRKFKELQLGDGVTIDYPSVVDRFFSVCYKSFATPEEMELTVRARLELYALMERDIVDAVAPHF